MILCVSIKENENKELVLAEMTDNTIIVCGSLELKEYLSKQINKIMTGEGDTDDGVSYSTGDLEPFSMEVIHDMKCTKVYAVDTNQLITITTDSTKILDMIVPEDLWFYGETGMQRGIDLYALTEFKGHEEHWEQGGKELIQHYFEHGRYGTYLGRV